MDGSHTNSLVPLEGARSLTAIPHSYRIAQPQVPPCLGCLKKVVKFKFTIMYPTILYGLGYPKMADVQESIAKILFSGTCGIYGGIENQL